MCKGMLKLFLMGHIGIRLSLRILRFYILFIPEFLKIFTHMPNYSQTILCCNVTGITYIYYIQLRIYVIQVSVSQC